MATQRGWPDWIKGIALYGVTEEGDLVLLKADKEGNLSVQILPHATTHQAGGSDEINVEGLKGVLADLQKAKWSIYDTRANFPSGSEPGELAYATDEKALYRWDGSSWIKVLSLNFTDLINRAHAADHQAGGSDEINVGGLHGELADPQPPKAHASSHQAGGSDEINVGGLHGELADPQPPKAHASSHQAGGSDAINVGTLPGIGWAGTQVYSGTAPTSWTDLDLSSVVGSRRTLVILNVKNHDYNYDNAFYFRWDGSTVNFSGDPDPYPAANKVKLQPQQYGFVIAITGTNGYVEWKADNAYDARVSVLAYINLD